MKLDMPSTLDQLQISIPKTEQSEHIQASWFPLPTYVVLQSAIPLEIWRNFINVGSTVNGSGGMLCADPRRMSSQLVVTWHKNFISKNNAVCSSIAGKMNCKP